MNRYGKIHCALFLIAVVSAGLFNACTKSEKGFLSPTMQYAVSTFSFVRGHIAKSYTLNPDGSSNPMHVKWTHIYDSKGAIVDTLFTKKYPIGIWKAAYNPLTDTTYSLIIAKRDVAMYTALVVNESNGQIETNSASQYLPLDTYTLDLEASNISGTQTLKKILNIQVLDGKPVETSPEIGSYNLGLFLATNFSTTKTIFNGVNNPFVSETITRIADTPNIFVMKMTDKNGVAFNPKAGEIVKRPGTGLNPVPAYLQNLQDYAPDTYVATDTAMVLKYPLTPFPITSLGNGFNMYYLITNQATRIDSTSTWSSNTAGTYYKGISDSHYLGTYVDGRYFYSFRVPLRIQVPGYYQLTLKFLNLTHK